MEHGLWIGTVWEMYLILCDLHVNCSDRPIIYSNQIWRARKLCKETIYANELSSQKIIVSSSPDIMYEKERGFQTVWWNGSVPERKTSVEGVVLLSGGKRPRRWRRPSRCSLNLYKWFDEIELWISSSRVEADKTVAKSNRTGSTEWNALTKYDLI